MFNDELRKRTYKFSKEVLFTLRKIPETLESRIIINQLIKSSTSVAANFRSACNCRSKNEWYAKLCIVTEEADESIYWIDLIIDLYKDKETEKFEELRNEAGELVKIFTKVKSNILTRQKSDKSH